MQLTELDSSRFVGLMRNWMNDELSFLFDWRLQMFVVCRYSCSQWRGQYPHSRGGTAIPPAPHGGTDTLCSPLWDRNNPTPHGGTAILTIPMMWPVPPLTTVGPVSPLPIVGPRSSLWDRYPRSPWWLYLPRPGFWDKTYEEIVKKINLKCTQLPAEYILRVHC